MLLVLYFAALTAARPPPGLLPRRGHPVFPWESPNLWVSPYRAALGEDFPAPAIPKVTPVQSTSTASISGDPAKEEIKKNYIKHTDPDKIKVQTDPEKSKVDSSGVVGGSASHLGLGGEDFGAPNPWDTQNKKKDTLERNKVIKQNGTESETVPPLKLEDNSKLQSTTSQLNSTATGDKGGSIKKGEPSSQKVENLGVIGGLGMNLGIEGEAIGAPNPWDTQNKKSQIFNSNHTQNNSSVENTSDKVTLKNGNIQTLVWDPQATKILHEAVKQENIPIPEKAKISKPELNQNGPNKVLEELTSGNVANLVLVSEKLSPMRDQTVEKPEKKEENFRSTSSEQTTETQEKETNLEKEDGSVTNSSRVESTGVIGSSIPGLNLESEGFVAPSPWDTQNKKNLNQTIDKTHNVKKPTPEKVKVENSGIIGSLGMNLGLESENAGPPNPWDTQNKKRPPTKEEEEKKTSETNKVESSGIAGELGGSLGLGGEGFGAPNPWDTQNKKIVPEVKPENVLIPEKAKIPQKEDKIPGNSKVESSNVFGGSSNSEGLGLGLESEGFFPPNPWDTQSKTKIPDKEQDKNEVPIKTNANSTKIVGNQGGNLGLSNEGFSAPNPWDTQNKIKQSIEKQPGLTNELIDVYSEASAKVNSNSASSVDQSPLSWAAAHNLGAGGVLKDLIGVGAAGSGTGSFTASTVGSGGAFAVASLPQRRRPAMPERLIATSTAVPTTATTTTSISTSSTSPIPANASKVQQVEDDELNSCECGWNAECVLGRCVCLPGHAGDPKRGCEPASCSTSEDCPDDLACLENTCGDPCGVACASNADCRVRSHQARCSCPAPLRGDPRIECGLQTTDEPETSVNPDITCITDEDCRRPPRPTTSRPPRPPPKPEPQQELQRPGFSSATSGANAAPSVSAQGTSLSEAPGRGQSNANSNSAAFVYGQIQGSVSLSSASSSG